MMSGEIKITQRLKLALLEELDLFGPADWQAYWKQVPWPKPNLVELAKNKASPLAHALKRLDPEVLVEVSTQPDPFGWLLKATDVTKWSGFCVKRHEPWMTRVWLAAASQLRAERRLLNAAHGWAKTWEELRRNQDSPDLLRRADNHFFAQLRHASHERKAELLAMAGLDERIEKARCENDQAFLRRLRRNKQDLGAPYYVPWHERFMVQHWLELPESLPGLCFFSDPARDALLAAFTRGKEPPQFGSVRLRLNLGLIQAGAKRHLIEQVIDSGSELRFTGRMLVRPWDIAGEIRWGEDHLWPR